MLIVPQEDPLTAPYWAGAREGRLLLQSCRSCAHVWHPPTPVCPRCQSADFEWRASSGRGVVHTWTVVHHSAHVAMNGRTPYAVLQVRLEEGPRVVGNMLDCDIDSVRIDMPVEVVFEEIAPGVVLPQFRPAKEG